MGKWTHTHCQDNTQGAYFGRIWLENGHSFFTYNYYTSAALMTKFEKNKLT